MFAFEILIESSKGIYPTQFSIYWWFNKVRFLDWKATKLQNKYSQLFNIIEVLHNLFLRFVAKIVKINSAKICSARISVIKVVFASYADYNTGFTFSSELLWSSIKS